MHDSTAKVSSGILNGNVNYFGDFDQCLNIQGPMDDLKGKYCLTYLQASIPNNMPKLKHLYNLMHSHSAFISEFDDVSMTLHWVIFVIKTVLLTLIVTLKFISHSALKVQHLSIVYHNNY